MNQNSSGNSSLNHLLSIQSELVDAAYEMKTRLREGPKLKTKFRELN